VLVENYSNLAWQFVTAGRKIFASLKLSDVGCLASSILLLGIRAFLLLRRHNKKEVVARLRAFDTLQSAHKSGSVIHLNVKRTRVLLLTYDIWHYKKIFFRT